VSHFAGAGGYEPFAISLPFRAEVESDIRLTMLLIAERDSNHRDASALMVINSLGVDANL
jgi:hypothetical protein